MNAQETANGNPPEMHLNSTVLCFILLACLHVVLLGLTVTAQLDPFFNDAMHRLGPASDFAAYHRAGQGLMNGKGAYGHGPGFGFRYHPLFAGVMGLTLSQLPLMPGYAVWVLIHEAAFLCVLWMLYRLSKSFNHFLAMTGLLVLFSPYYIEVYMGNASFITCALLLGALMLDRRGRHTLCGLLLALSIVIKPIGLVLFPWFLLKRRWKLLGGVTLAVVLSALPFFLRDANALHTFLTLNFRAIPAEGWVVHGGNQGFHGFVVNLCTRLSGISTADLASFDQLSPACSALISVLPLLFVFISALACWKARSDMWLCVFLWTMTYMLGYKDIWEHSYAFVILPLTAIYLSDMLSDRTVLLFAVWMALPTLFVFYDYPLPPGPIDPEHYWSFGVSVLHHATKSVGLLILYLMVTGILLSRPHTT